MDAGDIEHSKFIIQPPPRLSATQVSYDPCVGGCSEDVLDGMMDMS